MIPPSPPVPQLKPLDAAVSLRSLANRYRTLLDRVPMDRRNELDELVGTDGATPLTLLTSVAHDLAELETALRDVLHRENVTFALNPLTHEPTDEPYLGLAVALERVETRTSHLADLADEANKSVNDWQRRGVVMGGGAITAWDIAQQAVAVGVHRLRLIEAIVNRM